MNGDRIIDSLSTSCDSHSYVLATIEKASLFQQLVDEENLFVALGWYQKNRMAQSFCDGIFDEVDIPRCYELSERLRALDNTGYDCIVSKTKASKCLDGLLSVLIRNGGWKDSTLISTPATRIHPPNPAVHIDTRSRDSNDTLDSNSNNNGEAFMEKSPNPATLASG